jgi:hypothetical protein
MLYTPVSILVAVIIIADATILIRNGGRAAKLNSVASTTELIWLLISLVYLFTEELYGLMLFVPVFFVSYVVAGFISSFLMVRQISDVEELQDIRVPRSYSIAALIFGFLFASSNVLVLIYS